MSFQDSFKDFWRKWLDYYDTTSRSEFWKTILMWVIIYAIFWGIIVYKRIAINPARLDILVSVVSFIAWIPGFALVSRRLNDTGLSPQITNILIWAWILLPFLSSILPIVNILTLLLTIGILILCVFPTNFFD